MRSSLSRKILFSFVGSYLLLTVIIAGTSLFYVTKHTEQEAKQNLHEINHSVTAIINASVEATVEGHLDEIASSSINSIKKTILRDKDNPKALIQKEAANYLLDRKIGKDGYIYVIDSQGVILTHPVQNTIGKDLSHHDFIKTIVSNKSGYLTYEWKNEGEDQAREKAISYTYFSQWDWIVCVSAYMDDLSHFININAFKEDILNIKIGETGYPYVIDGEGQLLIHPHLTTSLYEAEDARSGEKFVQTILNQQTGDIHYFWPNESTGKIKSKFATFKAVDNLDWIVVSGIWTDELLSLPRALASFFVLIFSVGLIVFVILSVFISRNISKPIERVSQIIERSDLASQISSRETKRHDEIGRLSTGFNTLIASLNDAISYSKRNVQDSEDQSEQLESIVANTEKSVGLISELNAQSTDNNQKQNRSLNVLNRGNIELNQSIKNNLTTVENIKNKTGDLRSEVNEQAASITEMASTIEEMSANLNSIDRISNEANKSSLRLTEIGDSSKQQLNHTRENMKSLTKANETIRNFVSIIVNVASKTNLLAMNAAIEAAHAGEHGKGFAVVAEEIRKLSEISNNQAQQVTESLTNIENDISSMAENLEKTDTDFSVLSEESEKVKSVVTQIKQSTEEQSHGSSEMVEAISSIAAGTQEIQAKYSEIDENLDSMKASFLELEETSNKNQDYLQEQMLLNETNNSLSENVLKENAQIQEISRDLALVSKTMREAILLLNEKLSHFKTDDDHQIENSEQQALLEN